MLAAGERAWPPFALVTGLLLIGAVAAEDGVFEAAGAGISRLRLPPRTLLLALLTLVAGVTAVLNLDTSVVFMTPVLVHAARRSGTNERPFLYGSVFMANSASLLLPGSNLTNLLVLGHGGTGWTMLRPWLVSCALTAAFVAFVVRPGPPARTRCEPRARLHVGSGLAGVVAAAVLVLALNEPALPVLALGVCLTASRRARPRVGAPVLAALFALTVCLGTVARSWHGPAALLAATGPWATAATSAVASVLLDNLPAAVLLSAHPPAHPRALLVGLDLGPNLAVTGSLSAVLWLRAARSVGADASIGAYSRLGAVLVPATIAAALAVA
ncbi:MAG TPA: SLC13 family permease [Gaiellaceae bacterium]